MPRMAHCYLFVQWIVVDQSGSTLKLAQDRARFRANGVSGLRCPKRKNARAKWPGRLVLLSGDFYPLAHLLADELAEWDNQQDCVGTGSTPVAAARPDRECSQQRRCTGARARQGCAAWKRDSTRNAGKATEQLQEADALVEHAVGTGAEC